MFLPRVLRSVGVIFRLSIQSNTWPKLQRLWTFSNVTIHELICCRLLRQTQWDTWSISPGWPWSKVSQVASMAPSGRRGYCTVRDQLQSDWFSEWYFLLHFSPTSNFSWGKKKKRKKKVLTFVFNVSFFSWLSEILYCSPTLLLHLPNWNGNPGEIIQFYWLHLKKLVPTWIWWP